MQDIFDLLFQELRTNMEKITIDETGCDDLPHSGIRG